MAVAIYERTLDAVRADRLIEAAVHRMGNLLTVQDLEYELEAYDRVRIAALGKAAVGMATALAAELGPYLSDGLVITKDETPAPAPLETLFSAHPVPDERSLEAGEAMLRFARECGEGDLVLFALSGGASALAEALEDEIELEDLRETTSRLLASGAAIGTVNDVRRRVSRLKGGGLARAFAPATVVVLVLSDVVGGELASVGSGPLVPPPDRSLSDEIVDLLPDPVRREVRSHDLLLRATPEYPHRVVGSVSIAVHAAADAAKALGFEAHAYLDPLEGEARVMARRVVQLARRVLRKSGPVAMILGGETTVTLRGPGRGGRCQEMALAAAPGLSKLSNVAFLAAGTDGSDGPTPYAGGLVDEGSLLRARVAGVDHRRALTANDSSRFLEACGGLIRTGPTFSNVNDICLVVRTS
jgi:glycerate-2-kinase